jgi:hypothetical protein
MDDADYSTEIWKPIPFSDGYSISSHGRFRADRRTSKAWLPGPRKPAALSNGYFYIRFLHNGKKRRELLHRVVAMVFIGPPPSPHHHVAHNDGNPGNNRLDNLRWATPKENNADKRKHGTFKLGTGTTSAKLTEDDVRAIRLSNLSGAELAEVYDVTRRTIDRARSGEGWPHVDVPPVRRRRGIYCHKKYLAP